MDDKDAYYVVQKGDVVGVYKNLYDLQAAFGSMAGSQGISVYKGYGLTKEAEEYLASHGMKNASYSIGAVDVKDGLFGNVSICPFKGLRELFPLLEVLPEDMTSSVFVISQQEPEFPKGTVTRTSSLQKRPSGFPGSHIHASINLSSSVSNLQTTQLSVQSSNSVEIVPSNPFSCTIEFDGASKGNPGLAGAGVILRVDGRSMVWRFREGVGIATNNVAEYRAVILGLKCALRKGFKHVCVKGDSMLVCKQIQGLWKTKNQNMADLCKEAKELKGKFLSFQIDHFAREYNSEADAQANLAIYLKNGEVQEECNTE